MTAAAQAAIAPDATLLRLFGTVIGQARANWALTTLSIDPALLGQEEKPGRAHIAMALSAALFVDLIDRVPTAGHYVSAIRDRGEAIRFDHAALGTIEADCGALPPGYGAFVRFLQPLGYDVRGVFAMGDLAMTGRALVQRDFPETIPQLLVSELHVAELPEEARHAAENVFGASVDPLGVVEWSALDALAREGECFMTEATTILRGALRAFGRQHPVPALADYETLLGHSPQAAWVASEGNAIAYAAARVPDVIQLAHQLRHAGYPMKPAVDVSHSGRVRMAAIRPDTASRAFRASDGSEVARPVPGGAFAFVTRDTDPATGAPDLTFDMGNAPGIFAAATRDQ